MAYLISFFFNSRTSVYSTVTISRASLSLGKTKRAATKTCILQHRSHPDPQTSSQASDAQPVDPNQSLSSARILLPQRPTPQPPSSSITASQASDAQPDQNQSPTGASSSEAQGTPSTTREPEYWAKFGKATQAIATLLREWPELLPRFEQHMLDMSREEHE